MLNKIKSALWTNRGWPARIGIMFAALVLGLAPFVPAEEEPGDSAAASAPTETAEAETGTTGALPTITTTSATSAPTTTTSTTTTAPPTTLAQTTTTEPQTTTTKRTTTTRQQGVSSQCEAAIKPAAAVSNLQDTWPDLWPAFVQCQSIAELIEGLDDADPDDRWDALISSPASVLPNLCRVDDWPEVPIDGPVCSEFLANL